MATTKEDSKLLPVGVVGVGVGALYDHRVELLPGSLGPVDQPGVLRVEVPGVEDPLPPRLEVHHGAARDVTCVEEAEPHIL
jgi:hypothetical protein